MTGQRLVIPGDCKLSVELSHGMASSAVSCGRSAGRLVGRGARPHVRALRRLWITAIDLGDARLVRMLLLDAVRSGSSHDEALRKWVYAVDAVRPRRAMLVSRTWVRAVALVLPFGFTVLGFRAHRAYTTDPSIGDRAVNPQGQVLFTG